MNHEGMFYVGLSAQFPLLTMSLGRRVLKGWELAYKISQFTGRKSIFFLILYFSSFATSSPTHSPSSALSACVCFFCCFYSRSSRFFTTLLSSTLTLVSKLEAHSILIRINRMFIRNQTKKCVPPFLNDYG